MKSTFGFQRFVDFGIDCLGISQGHFLSAALTPVPPGALWRLALREVAGPLGHPWGSREWAANLGISSKCVWVVRHWRVIPSWEREKEDTVFDLFPLSVSSSWLLFPTLGGLSSCHIAFPCFPVAYRTSLIPVQYLIRGLVTEALLESHQEHIQEKQVLKPGHQS